MTLSPITLVFTPDLPPAGSQGRFIGRTIDGNLYPMWWSGKMRAWMVPMPHPSRESSFDALLSDGQSLIVGWAELPKRGEA